MASVVPILDQHSQLSTAHGGPELNHKDEHLESFARENRACKGLPWWDERSS